MCGVVTDVRAATTAIYATGYKHYTYTNHKDYISYAVVLVFVHMKDARAAIKGMLVL